MLVRKNTKAFKTILEIFSACQGRADREKLIRLFVTKAGQSVAERIPVEGIQGGSAFFYEMNYQTVLNSLRSSNHQLNVSDTIPGIYYFHSTSNKSWDETPFEFDEAIKSEFAKLPDLPFVRKKEKVEKFVIPASPKLKESAPSKKTEKPVKTVSLVDKGPRQPDFKLSHKVRFTDLDRIIFRQPRLTKLELLTYYNKVSEYLLPYLKDRPVSAQMQHHSFVVSVKLTQASLFNNDTEDAPDWLARNKSGSENDFLPCNDREHLLLYVESGALQFDVSNSRFKQPGHPDYLIIGIDSPASDISKAVDAALALRKITEGLSIPSFIKSDGLTGFHVYIPVDGKTPAKVVADTAQYLCRLLRMKVPDLVSLDEADNSYGKVPLDYSLNGEDKFVVAPYTIVATGNASIAAPLNWDEITYTLKLSDINPDSIFKRLKAGDPFEHIHKKKVSASDLLNRLKDNYDFLF